MPLASMSWQRFRKSKASSVVNEQRASALRQPMSETVQPTDDQRRRADRMAGLGVDTERVADWLARLEADDAELKKLKNCRQALRDLAKYCGCVHSDLENLDDEGYWLSRRIQEAFDRRDKRMLELKRMLDHRDNEIERLKGELADRGNAITWLNRVVGARDKQIGELEGMVANREGNDRDTLDEQIERFERLVTRLLDRMAKGTYLDTLTPEIRDAARRVTARMAGNFVFDVWENEEAADRDAAALAAQWRWLHPDSDLPDWEAANAWVRAFPDVVYTG